MMLTGPELLSKVRQLNRTAKSKSDYIRATGYIVHRRGRSASLLRTAFYEALLQASGVTFGRISTTGKKQSQLSFRTVVLPNGRLIVEKEYLFRIGLKPGDRVQVKLIDKSICLSAESGIQLERTPSQLAPAGDGEQVEVWFATNRSRISNGYGIKRSVSTSYGKVLVHVPVSHRFGETGSSPLKRILRMERRDDALRLTGIEEMSAECFFEQLRATISSKKEQAKSTHALIFLHGYNVTFRHAAIRAAQLHVDLNVNGATAFFSWPSKGRWTSYLADGSTIEASEPAMSKFLVDFCGRSGADHVHIVAHSMGNRGLLRSLQRITADATFKSAVKLCQVFLAAPDIDREVFLDLSHLYTEHCKRATLYASRRDLALRASSILNGAPRAGYYEPYTVASGVDTVAVPGFNVDLLGHGYYSGAEAMLRDMYDLMLHDTPPSARQRLVEAQHEDSRFWRFVR